ncbi:type II toxin-antitoxin system antitoxin SocA domain-containing protein [Methanoculleus frigidifontis]|nr:type II toxin-antitoxin system antitoxin SocA domain-containing protein [Methanoculleus sp. FWC-SCC1]
MRKQTLINALLYAVERDNRIGRTKLLKFIFLVDLIYYNQRGTTLCGTTYIRMPQGPAEAAAFQLTSVSSAYFDVMTPTKRAHPGRRTAGSRSRGKASESYGYHPRMQADLSLFTPYERLLLSTVLQWVRARRADRISDITHQFRLWKEFSDGEEIPLEHFRLRSDEIAYLERSGLHADGFERTFCTSILPLSTKVAGAVHALDTERIATGYILDDTEASRSVYSPVCTFCIHLTSGPDRTCEAFPGGIPEEIWEGRNTVRSPLNAEWIAAVEEVLDGLIAAYPLPALEVFYDAYLAWDDAYRLALRRNPSRAPTLATEGCNALCFVSHVVATGMIPIVYTEEQLQEFCDTMEQRFNVERENLGRDHQPSLPPDSDGDVSALVDMAMRISRDLACGASPAGKR